MSFNIIKASVDITNKYHRYLNTMFDISDATYKELFERAIRENKTFEKGPYLDVTNSFLKGRSVKELIDSNVLSSDFKYIKRIYNIPNLHHHQEEALLKASKDENLIVSTGTGSGKTECFLLPIINYLMREKENGTLTDGVRALIIYPMNALANDQIDRLRKTFIDYPDITFGCYTGQTKYKENDARAQYKKLNENRQDEPRLENPLPNERLSREAMKEKPPHILITNYAMLEYLLIRPEDNVFFNETNSKYFKYIVLDEAHTYTGSTGIEVSMLMRRLLAKINNPKVRFILTSATLGDKEFNKEVLEFAQNLTSLTFKEEDIIRASRVNQIEDSFKTNLNNKFYVFVDNLINQGFSDIDIISKIEEQYHFYINECTLAEYLYDVLLYDNKFRSIKLFLNKPRSILELEEFTSFNEEEINAFVEVASKACKNDSKLFDSRYHMFIRATEGVFVTLPPHKDLFLTRKNVVENENGEEFKVFEIVTCKECHAPYILGYIDEKGFLVQRSSADTSEIKEAFYIGEKVTFTTEDDVEENDLKEYELCPHCGFIRDTNLIKKKSCVHNESDFIKVIKVKTTNEKDGIVSKCVCCENVNRRGILRGFFSGQDASTAVIGTALFEDLPRHELVTKKVSVSDFDDFDVPSETVDKVAKAKQFIAFSDSRQAAAYFASYFSTTYDMLLYGRLICDVLKENCEELEMNSFINKLSLKIKNNNILSLDDYLNLTNNDHYTPDFEKLAYKAILKELVTSTKSNSLTSLGLLALNFNSSIKFIGSRKRNLTEAEVKDICMYFTMTMLSDAAIDYNYFMNLSDKEFFAYKGIEFSYLLLNGDKYVKSFVPQKDHLTNKRLDYLTRVLEVDNPNINKTEVIELLKQFWTQFFERFIMSKDSKNHYKVKLSNLTVDKRKWFRCNKCNKITFLNVKNVCPTFNCTGALEEIDVDVINKNNHYYRTYNDLEINALRVVEHTAQLNNEEAYNYQNLFKEQKLDVLSCSTTFEMGVDVGELETVFMRNMPPSAANYAQRAGRAGRSKNSAAFAITFCNKSNHDFNYFNSPCDMISGKILPPMFKVENEKISIRHLYSSALSFFFKLYPNYFDTVETMLEENRETGVCGYDALHEFLTKPSALREELKNYLKRSIPSILHEKFGIENFSWVNYLFSEEKLDYPSLYIVRKVYLKELEILEEALSEAVKSQSYEIYKLKNRIKIYREERIISFLSKNNILPKYGFPVDTVELELNKNDFNDIELTRDLSMAISEYAPGSEVVANDKLITSRYIKKMPGIDLKKYDYITCENCKFLNVIPSVKVEIGKKHPLSECTHCKSLLDTRSIKTFLIPQFGFIAENEIKKPSLIKPEKTYRTEASFFNYTGEPINSEFKICNTLVSLSLIGNDGEMAMLNSSDFFVCPICGYAEETTSRFKFAKKNHKDPNGYPCKKDVDLERFSLGYTFKTDVCKIKIKSPLLTEPIKNHDEAYSILQALILASAKELNIESKEIAGCLEYYYDGGNNYSYVLYDKTPGGAGHVKRLNDKNVILHILINAFSNAQKCPNCDLDSSCYSCLRTYENQKYHDIIKRKYVYDYLGEVLEGYTDESSESELEKIFLDKLEQSSDSWNIKTANNKNVYVGVFNNETWEIEPQVTLDAKENVLAPSKPDFVLTNINSAYKVAVFVDGFKFHNDILDSDSIKRDAILFSKNYRVFSFNYRDLTNKYQEQTNMFFNKDFLPSKLVGNKYEVSNNSFELFLDYLKSPSREKDFRLLAESYFNASVGRNIDKNIIKDELSDLNKDLNIYNDNTKIIDKYSLSKDDLFSVYLLEDGTKKVVSYINDDISNRNDKFLYEWSNYILFNNIMQFSDYFVSVTKLGIDKGLYSILSKH